VTNIQLRQYYQRATIFWHGAGFGVDHELFPERAEHFGMATVEAMSAGCIPFAYNAGGQKEIIDSSNAGYLWSATDELVSRTIRIMQNPGVFPSLQRAARERSLEFSQQRFSERLLRLLG
jgi:glycosyltransferase involved in cell wall biosynthesis